MNRLFSGALAAALFSGAGAAQSQPSATPLEYRSAFEGHRPYAESETKDWRSSNDTVRAIGGWRTYAREAGAAPMQHGEPMPDAAGAAPATSGEGMPGAPASEQPSERRP